MTVTGPEVLLLIFIGVVLLYTPFKEIMKAQERPYARQYYELERRRKLPEHAWLPDYYDELKPEFEAELVEQSQTKEPATQEWRYL